MIDMERFKAYLQEEELSQNTIDNYMEGMRQFAERYDEVNKANALDFKAYLTSCRSPKTVNLRIRAVVKYSQCIGEPITVKTLKVPKMTSVENVINAEQYQRIVDGLKKDNDIMWLFNLSLLARTGMRISEALRIKKSDLLNGKVIMFTKGKYRKIIFPKSLINDFGDYLSDFNHDDLVMRGKRWKSHKNPLTSRGVDTALTRFGKKYGVPKEVLHPHSFRHFFAIEFVKRNKNIALLADLLGHSGMNITQIYLRQSEGDQIDAVNDAVDW